MVDEVLRCRGPAVVADSEMDAEEASDDYRCVKRRSATRRKSVSERKKFHYTRSSRQRGGCWKMERELST